MDERIKKSILEMAHGGFLERADYEMPKIMDNIMDANTKATATRKLTITMKFMPDEERRMIVTDFESKITLAPTVPLRTTLYIAGDNATGEAQIMEMCPQIPGQLGFDSAEQEAPAVLRLIR